MLFPPSVCYSCPLTIVRNQNIDTMVWNMVWTGKSMKIIKPQVPDFNFNGSETLTLLRRWQDISEPVYILIDQNHVPDHCAVGVVKTVKIEFSIMLIGFYYQGSNL